MSNVSGCDQSATKLRVNAIPDAAQELSKLSAFTRLRLDAVNKAAAMFVHEIFKWSSGEDRQYELIGGLTQHIQDEQPAGLWLFANKPEVLAESSGIVGLFAQDAISVPSDTLSTGFNELRRKTIPNGGVHGA